jgi:hypothetical protein
MEEVHYSEMSVDFYQTAWRHIPQDNTLCSHCYENLKSSELISNSETSHPTIWEILHCVNHDDVYELTQDGIW